MSNPNAAVLRTQIRELEQEVNDKKIILARIEATCQHKWTDPVSDPIVVKGYYFPGDTEGGIDRRPPMHVPEQRTPRWKRTCTVCGTIQYTQESKSTGTRVPVFH